VAGLIVVIGLVAALVVLRGGGGDGKPVAAATTDVPRTTTTGVADLSPTDAFAQAAQRLRVSRTFAYTGTSAATDVSAVRPGLWLAVDLTVTGEVDLVDGRIHEIGTATSGRVSETVSDGITTWGRLAESAEALPDQDFRPVDQPRQAKVPLGAALLPDWLDRSVDRQSGGDGTFQAQLPAEVLGVIVGGVDPVPAQLRLTLGPDGAPTHVEVTVTDGPQFHLAYDLTRLGAVSPVTLPT
jgi:hypothetical protein